MTCHRYREVLPLFAGKDLDEPMAVHVRGHLESCPACRSRTEAYNAQTSLLRNYGRTLNGRGQQPDLWSRLRPQLGANTPRYRPPPPFAGA